MNSDTTVTTSGQGRPTMRQIARLAGVSPTVVSQTLNRTAGAQVAEHTRNKVFRIAEETGYEAGLLASSIKQKLRHLGIAIGMTGVPSTGPSLEIFEGIRERALEREYSPIIQRMPTAPGQKDCAAAILKMVELHRTKLVDGFVIDKQPFTTASVSELHERGVPIVVVSGAPPVSILAVNVDDYEGARIATSHLLEYGHRRIAIMTPPYACYPAGLRPYRIFRAIAGYRDALTAAKIAPDDALVIDGDPADKHRTYWGVARLMELLDPPTAIFVVDDVMALMVLQALRQHGLSVPDDVSVVGYGDLPIATLLADPELTTVHLPLRDSGRLAAKLLIDMLEAGEQPTPAHQLLKPELVIRGSTRRR